MFAYAHCIWSVGQLAALRLSTSLHLPDNTNARVTDVPHWEAAAGAMLDPVAGVGRRETYAFAFVAPLAPTEAVSH
jgi:hypothetical protein